MKSVWIVATIALWTMVCLETRLSAAQTVVMPPGVTIEHLLPEPAVHIVAATKWSYVGRRVEYFGPPQVNLRSNSGLLILPASWKAENGRASFVFDKPRGNRRFMRAAKQVALNVPDDPNYRVITISEGEDYGPLAEIPPSSWLSTYYQHIDTELEDSVRRAAAKFKIIASPSLAGTVVSWNECSYNAPGDIVTIPRFWTVTAAQTQSPEQTFELSAPGNIWFGGFLFGRPGLVADANQNGVLGDEGAGSTGVAVPYLISPNLGNKGDNQAPNAADNMVNGSDDLANFFPIYLDLGSIMLAFPPSDTVKYKLKQAEGALNFVYTSLTKATAFDYRRGDQTTGYGPGLDQPAAAATTVPITPEGVDIFNPPNGSPAVLDIVWSSGGAVILVEGRKSSVSPLVLSVEMDGVVISEMALPLQISLGEIAVDANRDGFIKLASEDASDAISVASPLRFWINDDNDSGDMGGDDIPGKTADANYADGAVNGNRDLVDFFPVFLDIRRLLTTLPPSDSVKYKLKQADGALNFVYTNLTRDHARDHVTQLPVTGYGDTLDKAPNASVTHQITAAGVDLAQYCPSFLTGIKDSGWGVVLLEGRTLTTAPLVLSVEYSDGTVAAQVQLPLHISNVEDMFRHINLTDVPREFDGSTVAPPVPAASTRTGDPGASYPDSATNGKYFVFVHGFNVNGQRARGWNAEIFKRLYQMGSHARFVGVTWNGATGVQLPNDSYTDYHQAVFHAFQTGDALAARLISNGVTGDVTIAAHSLGNVVVSQAIQDGGFVPIRYYMINAAVPVEAYHLESVGTEDLARMTNVGWKNPPLSNGSGGFFAANWYKLFVGLGDHRSELTWKERFSNVVPVAYDFYSPGDDVVEDPTTSSPSLLLTVINQGFSSSHGAWGLQELAKGTFGIASVFFSRTQAGWGESGFSISMHDVNADPVLGWDSEDGNRSGLSHWHWPRVNPSSALPQILHTTHGFFSGLPQTAPWSSVLSDG